MKASEWKERLVLKILSDNSLVMADSKRDIATKPCDVTNFTEMKVWLLDRDRRPAGVRQADIL